MNIKESLTLLGTKTDYIQNYSPELLETLPRSLGRNDIGISSDSLPFQGFDLWTAWELSWLNGKGKPIVAIGEFIIPATSPVLIESKSFKLYLNSFNQTKFETIDDVAHAMKKDLSLAAGQSVDVKLYPHLNGYCHEISPLSGQSLDDLDIEIGSYNFDAAVLADAASAGNDVVSETLYSNLLKSNCLVTNQPDWGSVIIRYEGARIDHEKLLRYLISFRTHNEFHEQCVERIYSDIMRYCQPEKLTVFARYTRRGGLDINPFRSNYENTPLTGRLIRQ
ncbi:NADPH-dependent 7-cyano-7-deazaguanine reductase QueF [Xenorhabdus bovienii]|uniref:NADPH-dependent 7-cyano-7-deazaguanine reductase QueF n=1 Tax=Xenorhabdus bovienii TaxID=40576 RepID=UPI0023B282E1|nr:NADPH-dependent 7-cyano-7-deazaguanine reductase QueF [Xenorhabdus bovienii]MDE9487904.1 NADPH-dependent 7-cyano-7-deazaguanine reductase QueF [Xenorhabdus bovienii]MDE9541032.1 NADPH-dependent 7-cyano-7-deazaguanine reductase QueF [Xenorhabdus bovienii]